MDAAQSTLRFGSLLVLGLYEVDYLHIFNVCRFDNTAIIGSEKVGPVNRLTIPIRWLLLLKLSVLTLSVFAVKWNILMTILCCHFSVVKFLLA